MTNGIDHHQGDGRTSKKAPAERKPGTKPESVKPAPAKASDKQSGK
jgi:hypothetical protein